MYRQDLVFTKNARQDLRKLSPGLQKRIKLKLEYFLIYPNPLDLATPLTRPVDAKYRWRIGDYRILFDQLPDGTLVVIKVQHRKDVYRK